MEPWIRAHAPRSVKELVGQEAAAQRVVRFVEEFRPGAKPLLLSGPPGTGKTSLVHAVASDLGLEVVELNASDVRNKKSINQLLGAALGQQSLFFTGKLILVDEVDGVSGTSDRGGLSAVVALVKEARFPVIATANDAHHDKLKALRKASTLVELAPLAPKAVATLLERIAEAEGVEAAPEAVKAIANRSGGDARAAVNDLQSLSGGGRVSKEDVEGLGDREQKQSIEQALTRIFKTTSAEVALPAFDNVDQDVDALFLWIDQNLPREYTKPEDLARAYEALAEADTFFGRIRRWQYYRFYVYIYNLLTAGIALAKEERYGGMPRIKRSSRPLMIWMANQRNAKRKSIAEKLAAVSHMSKRTAYQHVPYLRGMFKRKQPAIVEELDLSPDEVAWLAG